MAEQIKDIDEKIINIFSSLYKMDDYGLEEIKVILEDMDYKEKEKVVILAYKRLKSFTNNAKKLIQDLQIFENRVIDTKEQMGADSLLDDL